MTPLKFYKKLFINCFLLPLVICIYPAYGKNIKTLCSKVFSSGELFFNSIESFHNPLSRILIEVRQQVQSLGIMKELPILRKKKQVKMFDKGLKEMVEFLERPSTHKETEILNKLGVSMEDSINSVSKIVEFVKSLPEGEALYYRKITQAVLAVFNKHVPVMLRESSSEIDVARMRLILKSITSFDPQRPRFSLYKIKRAIEGRYSLKEFILCRI